MSHRLLNVSSKMSQFLRDVFGTPQVGLLYLHIAYRKKMEKWKRICTAKTFASSPAKLPGYVIVNYSIAFLLKMWHIKEMISFLYVVHNQQSPDKNRL